MATGRAAIIVGLMIVTQLLHIAVSNQEECPDGFTAVESVVPNRDRIGCFNVIKSRHTWNEAVQACADLHPGARLAVLDGENKNFAVKNYMDTLDDTDIQMCRHLQSSDYISFWINAARKVQGDCTSPFYWRPNTDEEKLVEFSDWFDGEPNCLEGPSQLKESCLSVSKTLEYLWNDLPCAGQTCSLCEIPAE